MNKEKQAISMTEPVVTYQDSDNSTRMQFILPSKLSSPPEPTNSDLKIEHRDPAIYAVSSFSGSVDHKESVAKRDELIEILKKDKIVMVEPLEWEFYRIIHRGRCLLCARMRLLSNWFG